MGRDKGGKQGGSPDEDNLIEEPAVGVAEHGLVGFAGVAARGVGVGGPVDRVPADRIPGVEHNPFGRSLLGVAGLACLRHLAVPGPFTDGTIASEVEQVPSSKRTACRGALEKVI